MNPAERMCAISRSDCLRSLRGDLTCIKSYPLDDAMVTRLIKSLAGDREPETATTEPK